MFTGAAMFALGFCILCILMIIYALAVDGGAMLEKLGTNIYGMGTPVIYSFIVFLICGAVSCVAWHVGGKDKSQ
jgi:hypothetical protein